MIYANCPNRFNVCEDLAEPNPLGCLAYYTLKSNIGKDGLMGTQGLMRD